MVAALRCGRELAELAADDESDGRAIGRAEQRTVDAFAGLIVAVDQAASTAVPAYLSCELAACITLRRRQGRRAVCSPR